MAADTECVEVKRGSMVGPLFIGIMVGAVIGGVAALLLAPRSGKETQQMIKDRAMQAQQMVKDRYDQVKARVGQVRDNIRTRAEQESQSVEQGQHS